MTISKQIQRMLGEEDGTRLCCHEAGHAVVALHFSFNVTSVVVDKGWSSIVCDLDSPERTNEERFVTLAGGVAAEGKFYDDGVDKKASARDQEMISERGGNGIKVYVPKARKIIEADMKRFKLLRRKLEEKWQENTIGSGFDKEWSFELLSSSEMQDILTSSAGLSPA